MIGNDIIDLALARKESNWKRPGFLNKIFTPQEQLLIANANNPDVMVWNLWSRKEAAYKIYNRKTGIRAFIPTQLECKYENEFDGFVVCSGFIFYTKTQISNTKIHTVALSNKNDFGQVIALNVNTKIIKQSGIPYVEDPYSKHIIPVSKSHHGLFESIVVVSKNYFNPNLDFIFKKANAAL